MCLFGVGVSSTLFGVNCVFQGKNAQGINYSPHLCYFIKLCVVQVNGSSYKLLRESQGEFLFE